MKTPMQDAFKSIEKSYNIKIDYAFKEIYFELQKQMVIDAHDDGFKNGIETIDKISKPIDAEQYYNENYNNEKAN